MNTSKSLPYLHVNPKENLEQIVIMLHGYGDNNTNFLPIYNFFTNLKNTAFIAPQAPFDCELEIVDDFHKGYQWFPLLHTEEGVRIKDEEDVYIAAKILEDFVNQITKHYNLSKKDVSLFGFSQGAITALYNSLYISEENYKCIVAHSGALMKASNHSIVNKNQNILLINGELDFVIPQDMVKNTYSFFDKEQINYKKSTISNLEHTISEETMLLSESTIINSK